MMKCIENHSGIPEVGDLLLVCVGATIGKVALFIPKWMSSLARSVALKSANRQHLFGIFVKGDIYNQLFKILKELLLVN